MLIDQTYRVKEINQIEAYLIPKALDFLTCEKIVTCIDNNCRKQLAASPVSNDFNKNKLGSVCNVENIAEYKSIIKYAQEAIIDYLNLPFENSEPLKGFRYLVGESEPRDYDFFPKRSKLYNQNTRKGGQRTYTIQLYLNDVINGGATTFPTIDFSIMPTVGSLLIWNNLTDNHKENYDTLHESLPPKSNSKFVLSQCFRQSNFR